MIEDVEVAVQVHVDMHVQEDALNLVKVDAKVVVDNAVLLVRVIVIADVLVDVKMDAVENAEIIVRLNAQWDAEELVLKIPLQATMILEEEIHVPLVEELVKMVVLLVLEIVLVIVKMVVKMIVKILAKIHVKIPVRLVVELNVLEKQ